MSTAAAYTETSITTHTPQLGGLGGADWRADDHANSIFARVMRSAPMGLLVSAALGLAIVGVFQYIFYLDVLPAGWQSPLRHILSASIALFFEALGLFFLITTVRDFSAGAMREGWLGLAATILLWGYAIWEAKHVASAFDANTPESHWAVLGIIGTIVCIVRIVEFRIALTVTSAYKRRDDRKTIAELTGKLHKYEAEKAATEAEKQQAEKQAQLLEDQRREQEIADAFAELETLRRKLASTERRAGSQPLDRNKRSEIERRTREFYRKHQLAPTQEQAARLSGLSDARSLRNHFPNGSWEAFISALQAEIQQEEQPEISTHN